ncbi:MAG: (2Fe-2S)-binding protein [Bacteroidales bacterium]|nr:(2Fe-2S)-binding protein [Bacteroidales bacterium]MCF8403879.1 (2Fe-2S)-binding protein [Bacteroidales bacterium]
MSDKIKFSIDGKSCTAEKGTNLVEAAKENGIYIPTLCHLKGVKAAGSCRICNVKINGRYMTACTTEVADGMVIENNQAEIQELRKIIVETLFVSGNHYCPACEKSGNCELQALGYKFQMLVPRFPYEFEEKAVDAYSDKIYIDRNRCILCKRCVRNVKTQDGKSIFAIKGRGHHAIINIDHDLANKMTDEEAQHAMDNCPVGSILRKERGYIDPIGSRKYDHQAIGSEIDQFETK